MPLIEVQKIDEISRRILEKCNVPQQSIEIVVDTINYANRSGIPTHGAGRLPLYVKKIESGFFNPADDVCSVMDTGAVAILDGKCGFGQVAAMHAVSMAVDKAKQYGISAVGVRNANNFGAAGYFGDYAARQGMAALIFANASPAITPTNGSKKIFGTNPLCFAFPGSSINDPIVLDMATTVVARGKIRLAIKNNEKIPFDWALDPDGQPTDDPNEALKGSLLPIGGYKGYGLSLFVDVFAGLLTGSAYAGHVQQLSKMDQFSNNGHLFILIDVKKFMTDEELYQRVDYLYKSVVACGNKGDIKLPGGHRYENMKEQTDKVELPEKQIEDINEIAEHLGISMRL